MTQRNLSLELLPGRFAIARLQRHAQLPGWVQDGPLVSITRTPEELSIICGEVFVPLDVKAQRGLRCLRVLGPIEFSEIGVLESLARPLAGAGLSIFALSTYDTDYVLLAQAELEAGLSALSEAGHVLRLDGAWLDALIRPMVQDDVPAVAALLESLAREHILPEFAPEARALFLTKNNAHSIRELVQKGFRYHVAMVNDRLVGFVGTRDNSHLYHMFVANEFQRRGLGRRLWHIARAECLAAGNQGAFTVNSSNNAIAVYERFGFVRSGPVKDLGGVLYNPMSTPL